MRGQYSRMRIPAVLIALGGVGVWLLHPLGRPNRSEAAAPPAKAATTQNGIGLVVTPLPDWFKFQSNDTVNGWIDTLDNKAITGHAWELWGALSTLTDQELNGQKVPIYETWWDADEALLPPAAAALAADARRRSGRKFERPHQFDDLKRAGVAADRPAATLFDIVKYNDDIKQFISTHKYNDQAELKRINDGWGNSKPIVDRKLEDFPNTSVMLKPVYELVSGTSATILPYWAGQVNSTNPSAPDESTWTKRMVVIPPGSGLDAAKLSLKSNEELLPAVPVSDFYNIKLTKEEANSLDPTGKSVKEGDYALLIGMHVSSREIDNWTWQTFWWSLTKPTIPDSVQSRVKAPFDHYQVAVGYSFLTAPDNPNSLTTTCFNPYLEAGFDNSVFVRPGQLGIASNCMSCHRCAAWPRLSPGQTKRNYVANGLIDPGDPQLFAGKTKTDFLWGVADGRRPQPPPPTPGPGN